MQLLWLNNQILSRIEMKACLLVILFCYAGQGGIFCGCLRSRLLYRIRSPDASCLWSVKSLCSTFIWSTQRPNSIKTLALPLKCVCHCIRQMIEPCVIYLISKKYKSTVFLYNICVECTVCTPVYICVCCLQMHLTRNKSLCFRRCLQS